MTALRSTRFADLVPLVTAGVGWGAIADVAPAHALIRVSQDTAFEPDEEGGHAFVIPVRVESTVTPEAFDPAAAVRDGGAVDLVAFHPAKPHRWALRCGNAEWLGAIEPQYLAPDSVRVWRTPLAWLQAGCRGIVLLSPERVSRYRTLSCLHSIVAEDLEHASELRRILERPWPAPQVITLQTEARHAA